MRLLILIVTALILAPYSGLGQKIINKNKPQLNKAKSAAVIEGRCAIIVQPDNQKITQLKSSGSEEDYNASVNDYEYYMGTSIAFLNSVKVKQISKPAHGILVFKSSLGKYFKVPLANFYWGIILFNGRAKPIEADITDVKAGYWPYMRK